LKRIFLFCASALFLVYVLAPVAWLVSSSLQQESEITSRPPHWVPQQPTLENFEAIFQAREKKVTYETRRAGDPAVLVASRKKAGAVLGWRPEKGLDEMIRDAWASRP